MITIELTSDDSAQMMYLLPVQGSLKTLELVEQIIAKIDVKKDIIEKVGFTETEIIFLEDMISILDQNQKLNLQALPIIRKILTGRKKDERTSKCL